jgi:hypothetical protein
MDMGRRLVVLGVQLGGQRGDVVADSAKLK